MSRLSKFSASNPRVWVVIGVGIAGVLILAEVQRRRIKAKSSVKQDFGAFIERFELLPFPQPPPPASRLPLSGLTFAINDNIDVKGYVTGYGSADWKRTHEEAGKTALVVTTLLKNGATCVGKTVMDELGLGISGQNRNYGTPTNPLNPSHVPGGACSGSTVAVAGHLVDFALGTDTVGCIRVPASFCGILGFRPSHGIVSSIGVVPNSQSLDAVGWLAADPSVLHRVGHSLLQLNLLAPKRTRRLIIADDLFQLSKVPIQKTVHVVSKATEKLSGYRTPEHVNYGKYIASNVPSLRPFRDESENQQNGMSALKALSSVMHLLQRYEFKTNHEDWIKSVKPKLASDTSNRVWTSINSQQDNIKSLYKVRTEMRAALQRLLKDDGILVIPTVGDAPVKLNAKKGLPAGFSDRAYTLLSISSMSGACQVTIPLGEYNAFPVSVSFIASHGNDKFLLDIVSDMYSSLQREVNDVSSSLPFQDTDGNMDAAELLKEKGNAAYKGKQWNKAVSYYTEAIKLNETNATYYSNRAAAYLELGCFQQAEEDCSRAISLDKKNVKAYLRRGTAKESLLSYKEALQDFKHALVLEPQNKLAGVAEKRLRKLTT
ncbi:outer envelope protein 64, mitochondrial-like [Dorcoceras hygrometricum]|uniref:Outer envelope protein 64, mitochondrial-like n=1 Tax=Dorcoceras hygrometricum TaxID=472368 RepID=A0A2Z7CYZ7_9LAMI|nr:outer envelope protein 64, mitochondrial-like [Dorcoceras hygrometricum]